jgi:hypothetical protein
MSEFGTLITSPGVQVWRIKDFKPLAVGADEFGCFFEGDAYITLVAKKSPTTSTLNYDIYFWLGSKCSQDESGTAALKTIELDDLLGGAPIQHRETQGNESPGFMSVFPAFQVLAGEASKSGFRKVDGSPPAPRLLQVKGKITPRMTEVPMSAASLNAGDSFILDANQKIFVWNGKDANKNEKAKAKEIKAAKVLIFGRQSEGRQPLHLVCLTLMKLLPSQRSFGFSPMKARILKRSLLASFLVPRLTLTTSMLLVMVKASGLFGRAPERPKTKSETACAL